VTSSSIAVLIVNWNTRELVSRCLDSLGRGIRTLPAEIIVVDNGSSDGSAESLRARDDVVLIENRVNRGFAAAVNQAYLRSTASYVLLLNSDVELLDRAVDELARLLDTRPAAGGAAPLYRSEDGRPQPFHFRLPSLIVTLANGSALVKRLPGVKARLRRYRMLDDDFSRPLRVEQPSASCLLLRRSHLPDDRIFDERFPIFFNDVQLARDLGRAGHELWVTPSAVVIHEEHASTRQLGGALKRQYIASVVRMLQDTQGPAGVWLYQSLVALQGLALIVLRRPDAMKVVDLVGAVRGDPGDLPQRPNEAFE
jgi:GT2 family glycosyltransferase